MIILSVICGLACGILSAYGIGGGSLLVVALGLFFNTPAETARIINLIYFIATVPVAVFLHCKAGYIRFKDISPAILAGSLGALLGSVLSARISGELFTKIFGIFICLVGIYEIIKGFRSKADNQA